MTENNKIIITKLNDKFILCHIINDQAAIIRAYDNIADDFPIGTIVNSVVEKPLTDIDACFIRYGVKKIGYLEKSYKGQTITPVQYKKEAHGNKCELFTDDLSIAGDYAIIFSKGSYIKCSAKISKTKSKILKEEFSDICNKYNMGILLRTACSDEKCDKMVVREEIIKNCELLKQIINNSITRVAYSILYKPKPQLINDIYQIVKKNSAEVITDLDEVIDYFHSKEHGESYTDRVSPRMYTDDMLPLSKLYGLEAKIKDALSRTVYLKSGANITFDQTEACMCIDINSSASKSKDNRENHILEVNLEAMKEIGRQLILRNISGIVIIDFINMKNNESYTTLSNCIKDVLKNDNVKASFYGFTALGLAEISRQKERASLFEQIKKC